MTMAWHTLHLVCTAAMTGLIWYVQCVHYPSFVWVRSEDWRCFHHRHTGMTGLVVSPLMIGELVTGIALLCLHPGWMAGWISMALLAVIWLNTFACMVPMHIRLERHADAATMRRLVQSNWIRTIAWSLRLLFVLRAPGM